MEPFEPAPMNIMERVSNPLESKRVTVKNLENAITHIGEAMIEIETEAFALSASGGSAINESLLNDARQKMRKALQGISSVWKQALKDIEKSENTSEVEK